MRRSFIVYHYVNCQHKSVPSIIYSQYNCVDRVTSSATASYKLKKHKRHMNENKMRCRIVKSLRGAREPPSTHTSWRGFNSCLKYFRSHARSTRLPCLQILAHTRFNSTRFCKHSAKRDWLARLYLQRYFLAVPPGNFCSGQ